MLDVKRRQFITLLGGAAAAAAWPLAARAQQAERMRRIGVLLNLAEDDPESKARLVQGLQQLGWSDGRNVRLPNDRHLRHNVDSNPAAQQSPAVAEACYPFGWKHGRYWQ